MAREIVTCTGARFKPGDKVRDRRTGRVIRVEGGLITSKRLVYLDAETCELVHPDTPTTAESEKWKRGNQVDEANAGAGEDRVQSVGGGQFSDDTDCVIWGN